MANKKDIDFDEKIAIHPAFFQEFVKGMEQIYSASQKILEAGKQIGDVRDVLHAQEKFDGLEIRPFGDGGSHIVIRGDSFVGKKTKVIIKNERRQ